MACNLSKGRIIPCKDTVGGITGVYFIEYGTPVISYDATNANVVDDLGAITAYKYDIKSASNLVQTMTSSADNGTTSVSQALTLVLQKMTYSDNEQLKLLAYGRPVAVVHYRTGEAVLVGAEFGMSADSIAADSGTAMGDLQGYTITATAQERTFANYLGGATISNPFAGLRTAPTVVVGTEATPA